MSSLCTTEVQVVRWSMDQLWCHMSHIGSCSSRRYCLTLPRSTRRRTRTAMERCPSVLPLIGYDHAHQRNCWLFSTRKPKVFHILRQTHRYNKDASMNVLNSILRLSIRHGLPNTNNEDTEAKGFSNGRNSKRGAGTVTKSRFFTREFINTL